ncbi:hypothetical protein I79_019681 [Cricetulus griseus]|uniref:Uncharacterized protein n=1 Tax=Cricetulus griseus TaxID=10029 RepID=G3I824_CRIGR|nr:hypothetical protein I79_019681 [Cricetulus griseus]
MAAEVENPEDETSPSVSSCSDVAPLWRLSCAEDLTVLSYSCGIRQGPLDNILIINEGWCKEKANRAIYFPSLVTNNSRESLTKGSESRS